jgi:hypothetical protein
LWGAFDIAARDGTATVRLSALEDVTGTALGLVDKALQTYERIPGAAMPRVESYERIRTAEEQWEDTAALKWRKSTYSSNGGGEFVEVGSADRVLVRDTQDRSGPVLRFSPAAWRKFADQVRTGA